MADHKELKAAIMGTFGELQRDEGGSHSLIKWAPAHPTEFFPKVLPQQLLKPIDVLTSISIYSQVVFLSPV